MPDESAKPLLEARGVSAGYYGRPVVRDCDLVVKEGQVVLLMGRNGVGKTTLVSTFSGRIRSISGIIEFDQRRIEHLPAFRRSRLGIAHVPQGREVIPNMTVHENLLLASGRTHLESEETEHLFGIFPILHDRLEQRAGTLSGGEQQMLAIGRALLTHSKLMILDEPSLGLAPLVAEEVFERIAELVSTLNLTVLLVEQQTSWAWRAGLIDFIYVLENGTISLKGKPQQFDLKVLEGTYLGA